ncbi:hypothetical protein CLAIMM_12815, partial [Cladophialophora immunda]
CPPSFHPAQMCSCSQVQGTFVDIFILTQCGFSQPAKRPVSLRASHRSSRHDLLLKRAARCLLDQASTHGPCRLQLWPSPLSSVVARLVPRDLHLEPCPVLVSSTSCDTKIPPSSPPPRQLVFGLEAISILCTYPIQCEELGNWAATSGRQTCSKMLLPPKPRDGLRL